MPQDARELFFHFSVRCTQAVRLELEAGSGKVCQASHVSTAAL